MRFTDETDMYHTGAHAALRSTILFLYETVLSFVGWVVSIPVASQRLFLCVLVCEAAHAASRKMADAYQRALYKRVVSKWY